MAVTHKLNLPKTKDDYYFVAGDWHIGHDSNDNLHKPSLDILIQMAEDYPKARRKLIINGDFVDAAQLMSRSPDYKKWIKRSDGIEEFFLPLCEEEVNRANDILDRLQKTFKEIHYMSGNHDQRYYYFDAPPAYEHNFDLAARLNLLTRKISFYNYPDWLDIGDKLTINHGIAHGTTAVKKHYEASTGKSVIFSHVHNFEVKSFSNRGDTVQCMSLPAMSGLNVPYIKTNIHNWSNGFAVVTMRPTGIFNTQVYQVWQEELHVGTKIYK